MKRQNTSTLRRALAVLLSVVMALTMALPAFARGGDTAELYTDDLGRDAVNIPVTGTAALDLSDKPAGYTFKVYDLVYVMTSGGPVNATQLMSTYSYKLSFDNFLYSKGSAVANVLLVILLLVGIVYLRITSRGEAAYE